jgi:hypothetical protein
MDSNQIAVRAGGGEQSSTVVRGSSFAIVNPIRRRDIDRQFYHFTIALRHGKCLA